MERQCNNSRGFTLIEVMIAMFLFGVAFLGSASLLEGALRRTSTTTQFTRATWEVSEAIESMKNLRFFPRVQANLAAGIVEEDASIPQPLAANGFDGDGGGGALGDSYDQWLTDPRSFSDKARTVALPNLPGGVLNWFVEDDRSDTRDAKSKRIAICVSWSVRARGQAGEESGSCGGSGGSEGSGKKDEKRVFGTLIKTVGI